MNNVTVRLDSKTVRKIVEAHLNVNLLANNQRAQARIIGTDFDPMSPSDSNVPNVALCITFDTVEI